MSTMMTGKRAMTKKFYRKNYSPSFRNQQKLSSKQTKQVKTLIRADQEMKFRAYEQSGGVPLIPVIDGQYFDISQGQGDSQRIGDSLQWAGYIDIRLSLIFRDIRHICRFIVFQWHPTSTSAPSPQPDDILLPGIGGVNVDIHSMYSHDRKQNYKILMDRTFTLVGNGTQTGAISFPLTTSAVQYHRLLVPLKRARKNVQFIGGGLQATNRLFILRMSDSSGTDPIYNLTTMVNYYDS